MSDADELASIAVGSTWRHNPPGREVVRIERVWLRGHPVAEPTVRAHPTTGGRPLIAPIEYLREHYTELTEGGADRG